MISNLDPANGAHLARKWSCVWRPDVGSRLYARGSWQAAGGVGGLAWLQTGLAQTAAMYTYQSVSGNAEVHIPMMDHMGNVRHYYQIKTTGPGASASYVSGQVTANLDYDAFGREVRATGTKTPASGQPPGLAPGDPWVDNLPFHRSLGVLKHIMTRLRRTRKSCFSMISNTNIADCIVTIKESLWTHRLWLWIFMFGMLLILSFWKTRTTGSQANGMKWILAIVICITILHFCVIHAGESFVRSSESGLYMGDVNQQIQKGETRETKRQLADSKLIGNSLLYGIHVLLFLRMIQQVASYIPAADRGKSKSMEYKKRTGKNLPPENAIPPKTPIGATYENNKGVQTDIYNPITGDLFTR